MKPDKRFHKTEDSLLYARLADAVGLCLAHNRTNFVGFLDERETALAESWVASERIPNVQLWGGYPDAERKMLGVFPDFCEPDLGGFPLVAVTVAFRPQDPLTHRDFLGAFLSHGVRRDAIGDILVEPGRSVIFVRQEVAGYLVGQVEKIGRVGVRIQQGTDGDLPSSRDFLEIPAVVSSLRLDCMVAACTRLSREKAGDLIREGLVLLNHQAATVPSRIVQSGDKLSIRGKGRFLLDSVGAATKKGRFHILMKKYS